VQALGVERQIRNGFLERMGQMEEGKGSQREQLEQSSRQFLVKA
jgi:hypothetical protein